MKSRQHKLLPAPPPRTWQERAETLDAVGDPLGPLFWSVLRSMELWMESRPEGRPALFADFSDARRERFAAAATVEPELTGALEVCAGLLDAPGATTEGDVAIACDAIRGWAEARGLTRTAALFAESAAYADPESAARANHAGRLCRRTAQAQRAEVWYDRALKLGIRSKEPDQQLRAQLGYGNLLRTMGRYEESRKVLVRAERRARRHNRKRVAAEAHHDLLALQVYTGSVEEGAKHLSAALVLYPYKHPRLPVLIHDWGVLLLHRRYYSAAVEVLEQVTSLHHHDHHLEALCLSSLAHASAAAGEFERFLVTQGAAIRISSSYDEFLPAVLDNVAHGWRAHGKWGEAHRFAERACTLARSRGDDSVEESARALVAEIAKQSRVPQGRAFDDREFFQELLGKSRRKLRWWLSPRGASHPSVGNSVARSSNMTATGFFD
jgi:tetratricopeptide (TPR) repeat protein